MRIYAQILQQLRATDKYRLHPAGYKAHLSLVTIVIVHGLDGQGLEERGTE